MAPSCSRKILPRRLSIADQRRRSPRRGSESASASPTVTPITGMPAASAMPCASASAARMPVKLPGPTVTATRSSAVARSFASSSTALAITGNNAA